MIYAPMAELTPLSDDLLEACDLVMVRLSEDLAREHYDHQRRIIVLEDEAQTEIARMTGGRSRDEVMQRIREMRMRRLDEALAQAKRKEV